MKSLKMEMRMMERKTPLLILKTKETINGQDQVHYCLYFSVNSPYNNREFQVSNGSTSPSTLF